VTELPDIDPYAELGVERTATTDEVHAAYRRLVVRFHPDKHAGNPLEPLASEKLERLHLAYQVLSDPTRRAEYDRRANQKNLDKYFASQAPKTAGSRIQAKVVVAVLLGLLLLPFVLRVVAILFRALRGTPFGLVVAVLAVMAGIYWWRSRRRALGPAVPPPPKGEEPIERKEG